MRGRRIPSPQAPRAQSSLRSAPALPCRTAVLQPAAPWSGETGRTKLAARRGRGRPLSITGCPTYRPNHCWAALVALMRNSISARRTTFDEDGSGRIKGAAGFGGGCAHFRWPTAWAWGLWAGLPGATSWRGAATVPAADLYVGGTWLGEPVSSSSVSHSDGRAVPNAQLSGAVAELFGAVPRPSTDTDRCAPKPPQPDAERRPYSINSTSL